MRTLVLAAAALFILTGVDAKCKGNKVKQFDKCLASGFQSTLEGCSATEKGKLRKRRTKKCERVEKILNKCEYTCIPTVDGGWSDLGDWSVCSAECGGGSQIRSKTCTNPSPANGGKECEGEDEESRTCNPEPCPGQSTFYDISHILR